MAFTSGTATGFNDLYAKLRDFLTTNATLVAAGQNWDVVFGPSTGPLTFTDQLLLKGPGAAGTDEILVSLEPNVSVVGDYYNLGINGLSSYNPAVTLLEQANRSGARYLHLWDGSMPYWFIANGRRFIVIVRVSSVYQSAYAGFILPYHLPNTWPYPLYIGGCSNQPTWRYSVNNDGRHGAFFDPGDGAAALRNPDGTWLEIFNRRNYNNNDDYAVDNLIGPWAAYLGNPSRRTGLDGLYKPIPSEIVLSQPYGATMGNLQGVYHVPGFGTGSENTFTVGTKNYLVVQNVYRTGNDDYAAIELE